MKANTVVFTCADGTVRRMPLDWLIEHDALIADTVNDAPIEQTIKSHNQLWIGSSSGRFFLKDIVGIDFVWDENPPAPPSYEPTDRSYSNRPNIGIVGAAYTYTFGNTIRFEGWASDFDKAVTAVEFSLDGGNTWTRYGTEGATADRWVWWSFDFNPSQPGDYQFKARAINEEGTVTPVAAVHRFSVL